MKIPLRLLPWIVALLFGGSLFAQQGEPSAAVPAVDEAKGGFIGPDPAYSRIQDVQFLPSGSVIRISGNIVGRIKENVYLLEEPDRGRSADNRVKGGRIAVEIGDDLWQGQVIETVDWTHLIGEVKRSNGVVTIKARKVTKDLAYARGLETVRRREQEAARRREQQQMPIDRADPRRHLFTEQIERRRQESVRQEQGGREANRTGTSDSSEHEAARIFVNETLETPLLVYRIEMGNYPTTEQGLAALIKAPSENAANWQGPYVKKLPNDPWGNAYQYRFPGTRNLGSYDIWSYGPDSVESADDIVNWPSTD